MTLIDAACFTRLVQAAADPLWFRFAAPVASTMRVLRMRALKCLFLLVLVQIYYRFAFAAPALLAH